jgi:hypothetical protein
MLGLDPLRANWTRALTALVATPPRAPGDWSGASASCAHASVNSFAPRTSSSSIGRSPRTDVPTSTERSRATRSRSPTSLGASAAPTRWC